jgi:hypothetical protein
MVLARYDMVSRAGDVQDGVGDRRGAGSDGERTHAPFQGGDAALEHVLRRVGQAAVDVARVCQSETGRRMRGVMEDVRRSLIDGDGARVGCGIGCSWPTWSCRVSKWSFLVLISVRFIYLFLLAKLLYADLSNKKVGKLRGIL